jgi:DNA primase catalytic core
MYFKEHVIEQIREHNDIVSIISEYMTLTKKGNSYVGLCPFHNEKTPSFTVSQEKQLYYCFGCGNGGNIITFLMQKDNMNFVEAVKYLAERANIRIEEQLVIWDRFYKGDYSRSKDKTGTGLGLVIVKEILNKHEEKAGVISSEEEGENMVEFYFSLQKG